MRRILSIFIILLSLPTMAYIVYSCVNPWISEKEQVVQTVFTTEQWNDHPDKRIYMIEDLLNRYNFKSMSKNEIIELLGTNDCLVLDDEIIYTIGTKNKELFLFYHYFCIKFDDSGNVVETYVYQD